MSLLKVKNNGKTVLFIESMGAVLRPFKTAGDYIVVDEEKAKNDMQLVKSVLNGSISVYDLDGTQWSYVKAEQVVTSKKTIAPVKEEKPKAAIKKGKKAAEELVLTVQEKRRVTPPIDDEPKNNRPVVMSGDMACRKGMTKNSDMGVPNFVSKDQVVSDQSSLEDDPENGDIQSSDILLV
jgi:hypothetical protein